MTSSSCGNRIIGVVKTCRPGQRLPNNISPYLIDLLIGTIAMYLIPQLLAFAERRPFHGF